MCLFFLQIVSCCVGFLLKKSVKRDDADDSSDGFGDFL